MTDNIEELVDQRVSVYGDPVACYIKVATVWSAILDHEVQPWQVPLLMMGLKLLRTAETPDYSDNSDDIEGYLDIFRKMIGSDMVQARSVAEYLLKKESPHASHDLPGFAARAVQHRLDDRDRDAGTEDLEADSNS